MIILIIRKMTVNLTLILMLYYIVDSYLSKFKSSYNLIIPCVLFIYLVYNHRRMYVCISRNNRHKR